MRSLGEAAGLQAGDIIFSVDGQDISLLKHKEAQEAIKRAGHNFVLTVGRYDHGFFLTILRSGLIRNKRVIFRYNEINQQKNVTFWVPNTISNIVQFWDTILITDYGHPMKA